MKVWLELNPDEAERMFDSVKEFTVDRMQTFVVKTRPEENTEESEQPVSLEQIRAILAEKSQSGKQPQVKALITKFGAKKLTDIDPACYKELLKQAEEL